MSVSIFICLYYIEEVDLRLYIEKSKFWGFLLVWFPAMPEI